MHVLTSNRIAQHGLRVVELLWPQDLYHRAVPHDGHPVADGLDLLRGKTGIHSRVDHAAGEGIYRDSAGCQFFGEGFCQGVESALCGRVGGFAGSSYISPDRRYIQNPALFGMDHMGKDLAAQEKGRREICI